MNALQKDNITEISPVNMTALPNKNATNNRRRAATGPHMSLYAANLSTEFHID
jgi:hypothetical protein